MLLLLSNRKRPVSRFLQRIAGFRIVMLVDPALAGVLQCGRLVPKTGKFTGDSFDIPHRPTGYLQGKGYDLIDW